MTAASLSGGLSISWGAEHRDGKGVLISRQASIQEPVVPQCIRFKCLWKYLIESLTYVLVASYHARRVTFAEANRGKDILERYRTGVPSPDTLWSAIHANIKLTCPVCRHYNVDPLLGGK
jgi:hypothetical protein